MVSTRHEPSADETMAILKGMRPKWEEHQKELTIDNWRLAISGPSFDNRHSALGN
jgi:ATP-dependent Clp protease ATP-binding subunit ClpA